MSNPIIDAKRHLHVRHMIIGLAVLSIGAHAIIIVGLAIVGYLGSTCT